MLSNRRASLCGVIGGELAVLAPDLKIGCVQKTWH